VIRAPWIVGDRRARGLSTSTYAIGYGAASRASRQPDARPKPRRSPSMAPWRQSSGTRGSWNP